MATGGPLVYLDADCRAPLMWLERIDGRFLRDARIARSQKNRPALEQALRTNTDVALTLYRNGSWLAARGAA